MVALLAVAGAFETGAMEGAVVDAVPDFAV